MQSPSRVKSMVNEAESVQKLIALAVADQCLRLCITAQKAVCLHLRFVRTAAFGSLSKIFNLHLICMIHWWTKQVHYIMCYMILCKMLQQL